MIYRPFPILQKKKRDQQTAGSLLILIRTDNHRSLQSLDSNQGPKLAQIIHSSYSSWLKTERWTDTTGTKNMFLSHCLIPWYELKSLTLLCERVYTGTTKTTSIESPLYKSSILIFIFIKYVYFALNGPLNTFVTCNR